MKEKRYKAIQRGHDNVPRREREKEREIEREKE